MKKISLFLLCLGIGMIGLFVISVANNNDIVWKTEYEKGTFDNSHINEYNSDNYKNILINKNRINAINQYNFVVPNNTYLCNISDFSITYKNDNLYVSRNIGLIKEGNIDFIKSFIDRFELNNYLRIFSYQMKNGNQAYLIKTGNENNYREILYLYIKNDSGYYQVNYHLDNQKFSKNLLNNLLKDKLDITKTDLLDNGTWNLSLDLPNSKRFIMKYNQSKYHIVNDVFFDDYMLMLHDTQNNLIRISLLYDIYSEKNNEKDEDILDDSQSDKNSQEINGFQVVSDHYYEGNAEFELYYIYLDEKTILSIRTPIASGIDISDFLNITYE